MKTSAKFVVGCLIVTVSCFLVIVKLNTLRPAFHIVLPQHDVRGMDSGTEADLDRGRSRGRNYREQKETSRTWTRNRFLTEDRESSPELGLQAKSSRPEHLQTESAPELPQTESSPEMFQTDEDLSAPMSPQHLENRTGSTSQSSNVGQVNKESDKPEESGHGRPSQIASVALNSAKIRVGELPVWWQEAWKRSPVYEYRNQLVGDKPLFPSCNVSKQAINSKLYKFVEPPEEFLPPEISKNPCWYLTPRTKKGFRCIPYVYLAGVAKCGTSDLYKRLKSHSEFFTGTQKEYHWWERYRFGMFDEDDPEITVDFSSGQTFLEYLQRITGQELGDLQAELKQNGSSVRIFGDFSPSYLWDPHNWYVLDGNQGCEEPRIVVGQHIYHLWPPAKILLTFRHPTPRLYSRFLSRIHRTVTLKKATPKDFHDFVRQSVDLYMECFKKRSIRLCAYNITIYRTAKVRLIEGMYPVFMQDWLRIWPPEQMFIMRYEDYGGQERHRIRELMHFLGLSELDKNAMNEILGIPVANSGQDDYQKYGGMLPETKEILDNFYQPFVDQFAQLLNDERFLWKDVYQ